MAQNEKLKTPFYEFLAFEATQLLDIPKHNKKRRKTETNIPLILAGASDTLKPNVEKLIWYSRR
jgi:hypothetical protein